MNLNRSNILRYVIKCGGRFQLVLFLSCWCAYATGQDPGEYKAGVFSKGEQTLPYRLLFPASFDSSARYPLVIFLHGAFEKGSDNQMQLRIGGRYFLQPQYRDSFPAFVLFPQCPPEDSWAYFETTIDSATGLVKDWDFPFRRSPTKVTALLKSLLDSLLTGPNIDRGRIYIGGLSQGGMGVFDMVARYPGLFAAGFSICGAGRIATARQFARQVPMWIFHGEKDDIVPPRFSREFYKQLQKQGGIVKYTEYPGVFHNSWVNAFAEKDLLPWLFSFRTKATRY